MMGDNARGIAANMSKNVQVSRTIPVSLFADCIHERDALQRVPGAYFSDLLYSIRYTPCEIFGGKKGKQFLIKADIFDKMYKRGHRFVDFEDFCNSEEYKIAIPFLLEFTNISQELFDVAKRNPSLDIPIAFDVLKYIQVVSSKENKKPCDFTFLTDEGKELTILMETDKTISKQNARRNKLKGVVE